MRPLGLALIIAAALLHAVWNVAFKSVERKHIFMWWAIVAGSLISLPLLNEPIPSSIWPYALSSAVMEAAYFTALIRAYERSDFSLVYSIARGAAPGLLILWSFIFLGERLSVEGMIGLALLVAGLVAVSWSRGAATDFKGILSALLVALFISIYSAIDGAAVRLMSPAAYTVLVMALAGAFIAPVVLVRYGRRLAVAELKARWKSIFAVGAIMMLAYILVLKAYSIGQVSYAGTLRESSVVFAALAGWLWLGEGFGLQRTVGATLAFAGIFILSVMG
jgi:drug/metabolite transporter (DMT)-like permease